MSKKKTQENDLTMDSLLKMSPEVFRDIAKAQSLGFKKSLLNLLKAQYEQCNMAKESLAVVLAKGNVPTNDKQEYETALKDLYICMQLIEDRHNILNLLIEEVENEPL